MEINGIEVMTVNSNDLLYFENRKIHKQQFSKDVESYFYYMKGFQDYKLPQSADSLGDFVNRMYIENRAQIFNNQRQIKEPNFDFRESIGLSFKMNSQYLYGLPERADEFLLKTTEKAQPYRMYNVDYFEHRAFHPQNLYGSIPYLTAHTDQFDSSVVWMNSAETFVDIFDDDESQSSKEYKDRLITYLSESGSMEFFIFGNSNKNGGPKYIMQKLATITGYQAMPPYYSLGFHFSKWETISTKSLIAQLETFDKFELPVDVQWLDIEYTRDRKYFELDAHFSDIQELIDLVDQSEKRLAIITDPHIKVDSSFFVYQDGMSVTVSEDMLGFKEKGVFMRDSDSKNIFKGQCWPKTSVWIDFLNEYANNYWASLYSYDKFKGTSKIFGYWVDMNEPSVFSGDELTMPKNTYHMTKDYWFYKHGDVHNAYGILSAKSSYQGILQREADQNLRPFLLSRSFFFGSQKYGTVWTGDNQSSRYFMALSVQMCLTMGVSGLPFCGADVGGFIGYSHPILLKAWYQLGAFQPFFRTHAHNRVRSLEREIWRFQPEDLKLIKEFLYIRQSIIPYISEGILPQQVNWYNFFDSNLMPKKKSRHQTIGIGVFVKEGSIIPKKYIKRLSAIRTLRDPFCIDIYPTIEENYARGDLYIDDGETFDFRNKSEYTLVEFIYEKNTLLINQKHANYSRPVRDEGMVLNYFKILNVPKRPYKIIQYHKNEIVQSPYYSWDQKKKQLDIKTKGMYKLNEINGIFLRILYDSDEYQVKSQQDNKQDIKSDL
ncbi:neutral alpha-glucosidase ab [Stylonychia lemnae]|uniref:Neutral alpha-glucosidase ab n=1 Tax=Stylonychia lemnae TaxID=5949 RepID=A0A078B4U3_STYLE|nr:neutral alpha-glucosidase ab [Stylonychia lemnae]|eukprot:CDW89550.1 neutral alpha-glucosidase ab [Stylonychia lemnae]